MYPNQEPNPKAPYPQQPVSWNQISQQAKGFPGQNPYYQPHQQQQSSVGYPHQPNLGSMHHQQVVYPNAQQMPMFSNVQQIPMLSNMSQPMGNLQQPMMTANMQNPYACIQSPHHPANLNSQQQIMHPGVPQPMYNPNVQMPLINHGIQQPIAGGGMFQTVANPSMGYPQQKQGTNVIMYQNHPVLKTNPTLKPAENFSSFKDAEDLRKAMKGFGTDESSIIKILCRRSCNQRMEIITAYSQIHNRNLHDDIHSETSGNFRNVLIGLITPKEEFYAKEIFKSLSSTFTKLDIIIDVMCLMTNKEINDIAEAYLRLYEKPLTQHMREKLSGHLGKMLTTLAEGKKVENQKDEKNVPQVDASLLKQAINKFFKDEIKVAEIFGSRSTEHLKSISKEYTTLKGNPLEIDIEKKFSGDFKDALLLRLNPESQSNHFARRLYKSMAGLGTADSELIRLCITRSEIDMMDIKPEFQGICAESLKSFIEGDTSGDYKTALLTLCGEV